MNVKAIVLFVSMPIISAASMSCDVARIALPIRVDAHELGERRHQQRSRRR